MAELRYRVPKMHQGQKIVYEDPRRFKWLAAGRRWRKTTLAMRACLRGASAGLPILWGAPTYRQCRIGWDELYHAAGGIADFHKSEMEVIVPPYGGKIAFVSLDNPDNARGKTAYGAVIDEAAFIASRAWYDVIRPMLSDCDGWALVMGTPKGRNWFHREFMAAKDRDDAASWQVPTLGVRIAGGRLERAPHPMENPQFAFAEAEQMFRTMPQRTFQQEFLAEFIDDAGGVFRRIAEAATATRQDRAIDGHQYVFGVDWGKLADFTAVAVGDMTTSEIVYLDRYNEIDYRVQRQRLQALAGRFRPTTIIAERNSIGEPNIEDLLAAGLPVRGFLTTNDTKAQIIEDLALAFETASLAIIDNPVLIGELQAYEMERLPSGRIRYSGPEGTNDDTVIAAALCYSAMHRQASEADLLDLVRAW